MSASDYGELSTITVDTDRLSDFLALGGEITDLWTADYGRKLVIQYAPTGSEQAKAVTDMKEESH